MDLKPSLLLVLSAATFSASLAAQRTAIAPAVGNTAISMCKASDLSLATDDEDGAFNGMSHSGTLLVLRNLSPKACRVGAWPQVTFYQGARALEVTMSNPSGRFMHPGPVMLPVVVPAGAEVTSSLRWVSGDVYDHSVCVSPTVLAVSISDEMKKTSLAGHLCGDNAKDITYEATPLMTDPQLTKQR